MTTHLKVNTAAPYEVVVGHGVYEELDSLLDGAARAAIIHPPTLRARAEDLRRQISVGRRDVHLIEVPDGESAKSTEVLDFCWQVLGRAGFTRSDAVVGLGGGSTTDLAGFVAARRRVRQPADNRLGHGRCSHRRQNRHQHRGRQKPGRRVP